MQEGNRRFGGMIQSAHDAMNDSERFSKQMGQTFDLLQRAISELDLPLLQGDKLSGLVRDLREYSYQAGRDEKANGGQEGAAGTVFRYMKEFGSSIKVEPQVLNLE